jgi:hypothetical protein
MIINMSYFKQDPLTADIRSRLKAFIEEKACEKRKKAEVVAAASEIPYIKKPILPKFNREELCDEIKEAIKPFENIKPPSKVLYDKVQLELFKQELEAPVVFEEKAELEEKVAFEEKAPEIDPRRSLYHTIKLINTANGKSDIITYSSQADGLIKASDAIRQGIYNDFETDEPCLNNLIRLLIAERNDGPEDTNLKMIKKYLEDASCNPELKSFLLRKRFRSKDTIDKLSPSDKTILAGILKIGDTSNDALFDAIQRKKVYHLHGLIRGPLLDTHPEFFELKSEVEESGEYGDRYQEEIFKRNEFLIPTEDTVIPYDATFDRYNIKKDGNCLFTAMAGHLNAIRFLGLNDWNQHHIRKNLVKFYKKSPLFRVDDFYRHYGDGTRASYLKLLEEGCSSNVCGYDRYGTTMDVMAFAIMCKINVNIYYLDGVETCYYDTTKEELSVRYISAEQYDKKRKIPANIHKPMYLAFDITKKHFDLLLLKNAVPEPLQSTIPSSYEKLESYIPFPQITAETIRSRIREQRAYFYEVLRQEKEVALDLSGAGASGGATGGAAGGERDDGFGQQSGFPSVERMVRLKEQTTEPHPVSELGFVQDFHEQDPDIMARMINCLM